MSERLTVSVESGTVERLRILAGGERKIGAYLSGVAAWLWEHRESMNGTPLTDFEPLTQTQLQEVIDDITESFKEQDEEINQALNRLSERTARIEASLREYFADVNIAPHEDGAPTDEVELTRQ